jgi:hypothetical protein
MKLSLLKLSIISGSLLISYGCNTTEFADSSKKKPAGSIEAVSCSVSPKVVLPGKKVKVSINGGSNYRGRFEQKVVLSGSLIHRQVLSKQISGFLPEDGLPNEFVFNEQGDYEVQLSELDYSSNLSTTCKFKVYKECPVGTERVGANVAFILDNSGSHGKSDCPGSKEIKKDDNTVAYTCNAETNREKAVNYAVEILGQVGSMSLAQVSLRKIM